MVRNTDLNRCVNTKIKPFTHHAPQYLQKSNSRENCIKDDTLTLTVIKTNCTLWRVSIIHTCNILGSVLEMHPRV